MRRLQLSSNSDSQDQNIEGHYKQVKCEGQISNSQHQDSDVQDSNSNYEKILSKQEQKQKNGSSYPLQKSKMIKKNCQSAKASRQRKKIYLEVLEHTAKQLKDEIKARKNRIESIYDEIIIKFKTMNKEVLLSIFQKQKYLIQKIQLSKKLLQMNQELDKLNKSSIKCQEKIISTQTHQIQKNISPETLSTQRFNSFTADQSIKGKLKKKKGSEQNIQTGNSCLQDKILEKESILDLGINAYLYQFGSHGCYRMDVTQRSKYEWITCLNNLTNTQSQALQEGIQKMKQNLQNLQRKIKRIEYYMRQLKSNVKQKFVVQFLLDKQFFAHKINKGQKFIDDQINDE